MLAANGMNLTRSFCYWPDFHPEPDRLDERMLERFGDFLDRHADAGMGTVPTFIVGHMSGENWDRPDGQGRDLYGEVWMVARQAWFVRQVTERFAAHPAVAGWLLSNEMPLFGGPAPAPAVTSWAELLVQAVQAGGGTQPVSLGDRPGASDERGRQRLSVRATAPLVDFLGPHVYRMESDRIRLHLGPAFACESPGSRASRWCWRSSASAPASPRPATPATTTARCATSLLAGPAAGSPGTTPTTTTSPTRTPTATTFEMHFGLTDAAGVPKPHLAEVRAFAELLEAVDLPNLARLAEAALVVPSYLERAYPFTEPEDRTFIVDSLRQGYVAAWEADVAVRTMREHDGLTPGARLYLVPPPSSSPPRDGGPERLAGDGAVVYVRTAPRAALDRMFGVEQQLTHGLVDPIEDEEVVVTFVRDFGSLPRKPAGVPCRGQPARACVPACPAGRRRGRRGRPAQPAGAAGTSPATAGWCCAPPAGAARGGVGPGQPSRPGASTTRWPRSPASAVR